MPLVTPARTPSINKRVSSFFSPPERRNTQSLLRPAHRPLPIAPPASASASASSPPVLRPPPPPRRSSVRRFLPAGPPLRRRQTRASASSEPPPSDVTEAIEIVVGLERAASSPPVLPCAAARSGSKFGPNHPYINPASSPEELRQLGSRRVLVTTAELCWFVERARAYAEGIKKCGWEGELEFYETKGEGHVYFLPKPECDNAVKELAVVADFVRRC